MSKHSHMALVLMEAAVGWRTRTSFPGFSPSVVSITCGQEPITSAGKGFFILFSAADPDLQIRMVGGVGGHPHPKIRGSLSQDNVFQPSGPQFSLKIKGGPSGAAAPPGPSPGSATNFFPALRFHVLQN